MVVERSIRPMPAPLRRDGAAPHAFRLSSATMGHRGTETEFELTTLQRLERQGYTHLAGPDAPRADDTEVVLRGVLRAELARRC